ncbi:hypothetical protein CHS0354_023679 [Potamilus streckersoni]|uniref:Peptidase A9 domain-containing protein n=1 Tax=Potamilus streckersoni TaxID=2493646 RepID=A0AAE0SC07_9BIVA|nr:hypothetical protein CHS0354_023679 [Potamilus streckersoni]
MLQEEPCSVDCTNTDDIAEMDNFVKIAQDLDFDLSDSDLTSDEKLYFQEFIGRNRNLFTVDLSELGCTDIYQHKIHTGNEKPVRQRFYRTNPIQKQKLTDKVQSHPVPVYSIVDQSVDKQLLSGRTEEKKSNRLNPCFLTWLQ